MEPGEAVGAVAGDEVFNGSGVVSIDIPGAVTKAPQFCHVNSKQVNFFRV